MKDINYILEMIPHRYPFLLVDRINDKVEKKEISTIKNVTINEPFFNGHFPEKPVMPGVLILESMAQSACLIILDFIENPKKVLESVSDFIKVKPKINLINKTVSNVDTSRRYSFISNDNLVKKYYEIKNIPVCKKLGYDNII